MNKLNYVLRPACSTAVHQNMVRRCYNNQYHGFAGSLVQLEDESELTTKYKPLEKLPTKTPFMKNLFRAKFDTDFLAYPEFLPQARLDLLERNSNVVRQLVDEHVDSCRIDRTATLPDELIDKLRSLKLFGLTAPRLQGGAEFTHTERARIMEIVGDDPSVTALLFNHETFGYRLLARYGDDALKRKYLKSLIAGRKYATLCYGEAASGSDATKFETYAVRAGDEWLLNGTKVWVTNADKADLFVVVAKVRLTNDKHNNQNPYYAEEAVADGDHDPLTPEDVGFFLVEKNAANVRVGQPLDTCGLRGLSMCEVAFDNVVVTDDMVLLDFAQGYDVVRRTLTDDRYVIGCTAAAILKKALREATEYTIQRKIHNNHLFKYEFAQRRLGKMLLNLYAIESMIYYTTGIMDMYQSQDCELENAITKVFCTEAALDAVNDAMQLMGGQALLENSNFSRYRRDLQALTLFDHHNDLYRSTIALNGLQYISNAASQMIMENRNPLFYSFEHFRNTMNLRFMKTEEENPPLYLRLKDHLHPSLMYLADQLEYCVLIFDHAIIKTLSKLGPDSVHDQMYLRRMADCAIHMYAMVAVLSRASRSYCIGSKHADEEMVLAETFVRDAHSTFKELVSGLQHGEYFVTDHNFKKLSHKVVETREYFITEPLKLNY